MASTHGEELPLDEFTEVLGLLGGVLVFITLIGLDTSKGLKKGVYWIPGDALILTALTIQVMNLLDGHSTLLKQFLDDPRAFEGDVLKNKLFMTHCSRVMLCVLVGYLLPGMARPGYEDSWGKLTAVALSVFLHISSELFSVHRRLGHSKGLSLVSYSFYFWPHVDNISENSFIVSSVIISTSLVWLILLLSSATIANKSIRNIVSQRIPLILAHQSIGAEQNSWETVENQVLKSWIVARACYPEYIIARSVLASSAALAVSVCVLSSIAGWIVQGPITKVFFVFSFWFKFVTTILEVVFIIIGWAIIGWRGITSVTYYRKWRKEEKETWREYFRVEDFWTRHIIELQEAEESKLRKRLRVDERVRKMIATEEISISLPTILLRLIFWVQYGVVLFSKACGFLVELMLRFPSMLLSKHEEKVEREMSEYKAILDNVSVLGETPRSVFLANRKYIEQAKKFMSDGNTHGKRCEDLRKFLAKMSQASVGIQCLDPGTVQSQTGLKFLCKRHPHPLLEVESDFMYATKKSWKLTGVSLISLIVRLSPSSGTASLKAYFQASELMDFMDESDPETDDLLSKAADRVFQTLWDQSRDSPATTTIEEAARKIDELVKESEKDAEVLRNGRDSVDWKKVAAGNALYKLCKSIDCTSGGDFMELLDELQSALADIIGVRIKEVGATLVNSSKTWAQDLQESKLLNAIYVAGKSRGLMEELEWCPHVEDSATV